MECKPLARGLELFNLVADPAERKDIAAEHPEKVKALLAIWDSYLKANNVVLPTRPVDTLEDQLPKRVRTTRVPPLIYQRQFVPPRNDG